MTRSDALSRRGLNGRGNNRRLYSIQQQAAYREDPAAGLEEITMEADGNCLFRAVSDQIYHTPDHHRMIRLQCCDYIRAERDFFSQYLTEDLDLYCDRKERDGEWGDDIEIQALGEIYESKIEIYSYTGRMLRTFHEDQEGISGVSARGAIANPQDTVADLAVNDFEGVSTDEEDTSPWGHHGGFSSSSRGLMHRDHDHGPRRGGPHDLYGDHSDSSPSAGNNTLGGDPLGFGGAAYGRRNNGFRIRLMYRGNSHYNSLRVTRIRHLTRKVFDSLSPAIRFRKEPGALEEEAFRRRAGRRGTHGGSGRNNDLQNNSSVLLGALAGGTMNATGNDVMPGGGDGDGIFEEVLEKSRQEFLRGNQRQMDQILKLSLEEEARREQQQVLQNSLKEQHDRQQSPPRPNFEYNPQQRSPKATGNQGQEQFPPAPSSSDDELLRQALALSLEAPNSPTSTGTPSKSYMEPPSGSVEPPSQTQQISVEEEEEELMRRAMALSLHDSYQHDKSPAQSPGGDAESGGNYFELEQQLEYPESVIMCMSMGFPLAQCVKAREFVGDDTEAMMNFMLNLGGGN